MKTGAAFVTANVIAGNAFGVKAEKPADSSAIELPELPWKPSSLEPHISARTIEFHYGKHHAGYVKKINRYREDTEYENMGLETIIKKSVNKSGATGIFNNAAQVWNHTFYWNSMKPGGGGVPKGDLGDAIVDSFGSFDKFKKQFVKFAGAQFGSGWGWLVVDNNKLEIITTGNADTPIAQGKKPLLTVDVWEHAY
ncbi:MAG: hypothetical protein GF350_15180, partial [Chitinivibrionales bacterium]|nr:hypothetical protein [Chitinivibrionales bacterium]